jgi:hypothetical protein
MFVPVLVGRDRSSYHVDRYALQPTFHLCKDLSDTLDERSCIKADHA